jgi:hypothetical protein
LPSRPSWGRNSLMPNGRAGIKFTRKENVGDLAIGFVVELLHGAYPCGRSLWAMTLRWLTRQRRLRTLRVVGLDSELAVDHNQFPSGIEIADRKFYPPTNTRRWPFTRGLTFRWRTPDGSLERTAIGFTFEYRCHHTLRIWSSWSDSNRRPLESKSSALPSCATTRLESLHRSGAVVKRKVGGHGGDRTRV